MEYAEELLVAACARDRRDETPHQLWRDAYREWSLERLSSAYPVDGDPFVGTRMAEMMRDRRVARQQRMVRCARRQDQPPVRDRAQRPLWAVPESILQWAAEHPEVVAARRAAARADHASVTEHNEQAALIEQLDERKQTVSEEHQDVGKRLNEARGRLRQAQSAQQSRSRWAKLRGESFEDQIVQARGECEALERDKERLSEQLVQIRQQRAACRYVTRPDYQDDAVTAERQDRVRLPEVQQQAERAEMAAEFAGLRADGVWQGDEKTSAPLSGYEVWGSQEPLIRKTIPHNPGAWWRAGQPGMSADHGGQVYPPNPRTETEMDTGLEF